MQSSQPAYIPSSHIILAPPRAKDPLSVVYFFCCLGSQAQNVWAGQWLPSTLHKCLGTQVQLRNSKIIHCPWHMSGMHQERKGRMSFLLSIPHCSVRALASVACTNWSPSHQFYPYSIFDTFARMIFFKSKCGRVTFLFSLPILRPLLKPLAGIPLPIMHFRAPSLQSLSSLLQPHLSPPLGTLPSYQTPRTS